MAQNFTLPQLAGNSSTSLHEGSIGLGVNSVSVKVACNCSRGGGSRDLGLEVGD